MLPEPLLCHSARGAFIEPRFLGPSDRPWVRALIDEAERLAGRPRKEVEARLLEPILPAAHPGKQRLAGAVLGRALRTKVAKLPVAPRLVREAIFVESTRRGRLGEPDRAAVLAAVSARIGVEVSAIDELLFADLPGQRRAAALPGSLGPDELIARANLLLAQGLLVRARGVRIELEGNARAVVRQAQLRGLLCSVEAGAAPGGPPVLHVSGPLALFRHTLVYGRRLAELLPHVAWCRRFRLEGECLLRGEVRTLVLRSGDPIAPSSEPRRYDSAVEERFARDLARAAPAWRILREPEPVQAGRAIVFPDFALCHGEAPERRVLVEIVGFWTPAYLAAKLARYQEARLPRLLLCIDEALSASDEALPPLARVIRFRKRIDVGEVLRVIGEAGW